MRPICAAVWAWVILALIGAMWYVVQAEVFFTAHHGLPLWTMKQTKDKVKAILVIAIAPNVATNSFLNLILSIRMFKAKWPAGRRLRSWIMVALVLQVLLCFAELMCLIPFASMALGYLGGVIGVGFGRVTLLHVVLMFGSLVDVVGICVVEKFGKTRGNGSRRAV